MKIPSSNAISKGAFGRPTHKGTTAQSLRFVSNKLMTPSQARCRGMCSFAVSNQDLGQLLDSNKKRKEVELRHQSVMMKSIWFITTIEKVCICYFVIYMGKIAQLFNFLYIYIYIYDSEKTTSLNKHPYGSKDSGSG